MYRSARIAAAKNKIKLVGEGKLFEEENESGGRTEEGASGETKGEGRRKGVSKEGGIDRTVCFV